MRQPGGNCTPAGLEQPLLTAGPELLPAEGGHSLLDPAPLLLLAQEL